MSFRYKNHKKMQKNIVPLLSSPCTRTLPNKTNHHQVSSKDAEASTFGGSPCHIHRKIHFFPFCVIGCTTKKQHGSSVCEDANPRPVVEEKSSGWRIRAGKALAMRPFALFFFPSVRKIRSKGIFTRRSLIPFAKE